MALDPDGKRNDEMEAFCSWKTWSYYRATRCNWGKFRHEFGQHFTSLPYHLWIRHIIRHIAIQIEGEKNRASSHPPSPQPFDGRGRVCVVRRTSAWRDHWGIHEIYGAFLKWKDPQASISRSPDSMEINQACLKVMYRTPPWMRRVDFLHLASKLQVHQEPGIGKAWSKNFRVSGKDGGSMGGNAGWCFPSMELPNSWLIS